MLSGDKQSNNHEIKSIHRIVGIAHRWGNINNSDSIKYVMSTETTKSKLIGTGAVQRLSAL
jgi:hypothetical protein